MEWTVEEDGGGFGPDSFGHAETEGDEAVVGFGAFVESAGGLHERDLRSALNENELLRVRRHRSGLLRKKTRRQNGESEQTIGLYARALCSLSGGGDKVQSPCYGVFLHSESV